MKEEDKIAGLFRDRLGSAEMEVRSGFWDRLERDLPPAATGWKVLWMPRLRRVAAAASVALLLGAASAVFWYFSPRKEMEEAFTQVDVLMSRGGAKGDRLKEPLKPSCEEGTVPAQKDEARQSDADEVPAVGAYVAAEKAGGRTVHFSISIRKRLYAQRPAGDVDPASMAAGGAYQFLSGKGGRETASGKEGHTVSAPEEKEKNMAGRWAWQVAVGTSLPKGDCKAPLTVAATAERRLNRRLAVETGLQYSYLSGGGAYEAGLHALAIPVKLNVLLAGVSKVDLYATVGGNAEKTLNKSFGDDPVRFALQAGIGVRYKLGERVALFAEPSVSRHFANDGEVRSLRTERATNVNLLCGLRMTY